jgi:hypothetical protein
MAGGIFLHPDFGVDKTNKLIRKVHKVASRLTIFAAWLTALGGLYQLSGPTYVIALYAIPLLWFLPFTLV